MEIWEQSDDVRIAAAQAQRTAEFVKSHPVPGGLWRRCDRCRVPEDDHTSTRGAETKAVAVPRSK